MDFDGFRDGWDLAKAAFNKIADKYPADELFSKAVRTVGAGGEALVNKGQEEFPKEFVKSMVGDIYKALTSPEITEGISSSIRSLDEGKVKDIVDSAIFRMKDPETSLQLAQQMKDLLNRTSNDDLEAQFELMISKRPMYEQFMARAVFAQAKPQIEQMRQSEPEEIAENIRNMADAVPSDVIANRVASMTRNFTPEQVGKHIHGVVGALPAPATVSNALHGVADVLKTGFNTLASANHREDVLATLAQMAEDAKTVVLGSKEADDAAKKTFNTKKGGKFDL